MRDLALLLSLGSSACSAAYADQPSPRHHVAVNAPRTALALAPERIRAPYDVALIAEDGSSLSTYAHNGRYYVLGEVGTRYVIRVSNPTARRIEAVVSVDGLDVIDGESGDLRKRGYIVPPYGDVRIEGFRTSQTDVATFRFSSVSGSYAGKKGKARNVGVIAVALFEEQAAPEMIEEDLDIAYGRGERRRYDYRDDLAPRPEKSGADAPRAKRPAPTEASDESSRMEAEAPAAPAGGASASRPADCCGAPPPPVVHQRDRAGLGTEFGEQRYSAASFTRFVRAANKPIAIAELRYNNHAGLSALGIPLSPMPDEDEIMLRETADPFPGDRFARPPSY